MALTVWESTEVLGVFLGLLRSALTSEQAADMFRGFITDAILGPVAAVARARPSRRGDARTRPPTGPGRWPPRCSGWP